MEGKWAPQIGKENKYGYNEKELSTEFGLNWNHYGFRMYDPAIAKWNAIDPLAETMTFTSPYVYSFNNPIKYIDNEGLLPILINGRVGNDSHRGSESYWDPGLIDAIRYSGISNHTTYDQPWAMFVDGDQGMFPKARKKAGRAKAKATFREILSQLERNNEGLIIESIQIFSHSRGGAFAEGFAEALLQLIKENKGEFADHTNAIDFILHLAPHQSNSINGNPGIPTFGISHIEDPLSGNDIEGATNFHTNTGNGITAHTNATFTNEVSEFIKAFNSDEGLSQKTIDGFVKSLKENYNIKVTVEK